MRFLLSLLLGMFAGGGGVYYAIHDVVEMDQKDVLKGDLLVSYQENTPQKKYHFTEEEFVLEKGAAFAEGVERTKQRCASGEVETKYTKQQCLSYGYSPTRLHTCPDQKTADDFEYLCNNRHSDGYAQCLLDFKMEFSWLFEGETPLVKNSVLKQKLDALESVSLPDVDVLSENELAEALFEEGAEVESSHP